MVSFRLLLTVALAATLVAGALPARGSQGGRSDILIVVLSRTGNTITVAKMIQQQVGGDLVELELVTPYPRDYEAIVAQVDRENESGYLPPIATKIASIQNYRTVFLGFPTRDMQLPPPMKSFLAQHDLQGKTVVPFNTNAGFGVGSSFSDVRARATGAEVLEGLSMKGGYEKLGVRLDIKNKKAEEARVRVTAWLQRIGML